MGNNMKWLGEEFIFLCSARRSLFALLCWIHAQKVEKTSKQDGQSTNRLACLRFGRRGMLAPLQTSATYSFNSLLCVVSYWHLKVKLLNLSARSCYVSLIETVKKPADLRVSSLQCWLCSPVLNTSTPASCSLFILRSSCVRLEDWELRKKPTAPQLFHVSAQPINLKKNKW